MPFTTAHLLLSSDERELVPTVKSIGENVLHEIEESGTPDIHTMNPAGNESEYMSDVQLGKLVSELLS